MITKTDFEFAETLATCQCGTCSPCIHRMGTERDKWKQRALAAEAIIADIDERLDEHGTQHTLMPLPLAVTQALQTLRMRVHSVEGAKERDALALLTPGLDSGRGGGK